MKCISKKHVLNVALPISNCIKDDVNPKTKVANHLSCVENIESTTTFMFASSIYQEPIYNMMLGQQKIEFHSRFANYLENIEISKATEVENARKEKDAQISSRSGSVSGSSCSGSGSGELDLSSDRNTISTESSAWRTQAFHWQQSNSWMKAAACYFQAAKLLIQNGAYTDANIYFRYEAQTLHYC